MGVFLKLPHDKDVLLVKHWPLIEAELLIERERASIAPSFELSACKRCCLHSLEALGRQILQGKFKQRACDALLDSAVASLFSEAEFRYSWQ